MDELLRKEKYRCNIGETWNDLVIADLFIKLSEGKIKKPVKLNRGEYIPVDLLDFEDVKKSRLAGSLKKCIDKGWIIVENSAFESIVIEEIKPELQEVKISSINEVNAGIIQPENITDKVSEITHIRKGDSPFPEERQTPIKELTSLHNSRTANTFAITENQIVQSEYLKFEKLNYFQKLKIIKETLDTNFLNDIISKSNYQQLIHNATIRLQELKIC